VSFECVGYNASILDTCKNNRDYQFDVNVYQEVIGDDRKKATQILYKAMSDIIDMVDSDYTLG
jgi:hypothetical protein